MQKTTIEINACDLQAFNLILKELEKARLKHPIFPRIPASQLAILSEEVGEVAKDINDNNNQLTEVAQVACVAVRMLTNV